MSANCIKCVVNERTGPDLLCNECRNDSSLAAPTLLDAASRKFHAFEWLRQEAIKGNIHADQLMQEVVWLRGIRGQAKKALKECAPESDNSEAALLRQMCNASI